MTGKGIDRHLFALYVVSKYLNEDSEFLKVRTFAKIQRQQFVFIKNFENLTVQYISKLKNT